jgi:hypothetical protein
MSSTFRALSPFLLSLMFLGPCITVREVSSRCLSLHSWRSTFFFPETWWVFPLPLSMYILRPLKFASYGRFKLISSFYYLEFSARNLLTLIYFYNCYPKQITSHSLYYKTGFPSSSNVPTLFSPMSFFETVRRTCDFFLLPNNSDLF